MTELFNKVEAFQNMLVDRATGGALEEEDYKKFRNELINNPEIKDLIPDFVKTNMSVNQFWQFIKAKHDNYQERRAFLWEAFKPALLKLETDGSPIEADLTSILKEINSDTILSDWKKALERKNTDPEGAITMARTLIETTCKYILDQQGITYDDDLDLPKLYKKAASSLNLSPDQHQEKLFQQILGGMRTSIEGLGALRNKLSDAHGKSGKSYRPSARHSELAVNLAGTMCKFLIETFNNRK
ncbi:MAG: abortive infection family protein [Bacteroidales bacterium]|nr:abortive infection family protein [Bacteroidales bacterium]